MNANGPPRKREGRLCGAASRNLKLSGAYRFCLLAQQGKVRRCVCCGRRITNRSLGGHARKSALAGELFSYGCADIHPPIFLAIVRAA